MNLRILSLCFFLFLRQVALSQDQVDFKISSFSFNPQFSGDTSGFVSGINGLQSDGNGDPLLLKYGLNYSDSFEIILSLNLAFSTSSNNYFKLLLSDTEISDPDNFKGYYLMLGNTEDEISFYSQDGIQSIKMIDGEDKRIASSNNSLQVKIKRRDKKWSLFSKLDIENVWKEEGNYSENTGFHLKSLSFYFHYSSSNSKKLTLRNLSVSYPIIDSLPPYLEAVFPWNENQVLFRFNEPIDTSNLILNYDSKPHSLFVLIDNSSLLIPIDSSFLNSSQHHWEIEGIQDLNGNFLNKIDTQFVHWIPEYGNLVFNELMYDPSPSKGLPEAEYIELLNTSDHRIYLEEFVLEESSQALFPKSSFIEPNGALILIDFNDAPLFDSTLHSISLDLKSGFLSNSGECLYLKGRSKQFLDSLCYSPSWQNINNDGGISLELIDPSAACFGLSDKWASSISNIGGTPSKLNSIAKKLQDTLAPKLSDFQLLGPDSILFIFSESIYSMGQLKIDGQVFNVDFLNPRKQIKIPLPFQLVSNPAKEHVMSIDSFSDCSGNLGAIQKLPFKYALPEIPKAQELHFSEVLFRPAATQSEFIEIHNASGNAFDLEKISLGYNDKKFSLPSQLIYPDETRIICKECKYLMPDSSLVLELSNFPNLSSLEAKLLLIDSETQEPIHRISYHYSMLEEAKKQIEGYSLELISDAACSGTELWEASTNYGGSPQTWKAIYNADALEKIHLLQVYPIDSLLYRFKFSGPLAYTWPIKSRFEIGNALLQMDSLFQYNCFEEEWLIRFKTAWPKLKTSSLKIHSLFNCELDTFDEVFPLSPLGHFGKFQFNELLFNPESPLEDYVEFYLHGDSAIDIKGFQLLSLDEQGQVKGSVKLAEAGLILQPEEYYVFSKNIRSLKEHFSSAKNRNLLALTLPPMNADQGILVLIDSLGRLIDSVSYSEKMQNSVFQNTKGIALEKIDEQKASFLTNNWTSASTSSNYGTPTLKNSQALQTGIESSHWELGSARLSPDNDGYEDLLILKYKNFKANQQVNIRVIDRFGQEVYRVAERDLLGSEGFYKWDGILSSGQKAPWGAYALIIECFSEEGKKTSRLSFAILGKVH